MAIISIVGGVLACLGLCAFDLAPCTLAGLVESKWHNAPSSVRHRDKSVAGFSGAGAGLGGTQHTGYGGGSPMPATPGGYAHGPSPTPVPTPHRPDHLQ